MFDTVHLNGNRIATLETILHGINDIQQALKSSLERLTNTLDRLRDHTDVR